MSTILVPGLSALAVIALLSLSDDRLRCRFDSTRPRSVRMYSTVTSILRRFQKPQSLLIKEVDCIAGPIRAEDTIRLNVYHQARSTILDEIAIYTDTDRRIAAAGVLRAGVHHVVKLGRWCLRIGSAQSSVSVS